MEWIISFLQVVFTMAVLIALGVSIGKDNNKNSVLSNLTRDSEDNAARSAICSKSNDQRFPLCEQTPSPADKNKNEQP